MTPSELEGFRRGLRERGWIEGRNLVIDVRSSGGRFEPLLDLARDLARDCDVILTPTTPPTRAAMQATKTVPIVMAAIGDPVGLGFVSSLSRPGGNVTGVSNVAADLTAKRLALLREALPAIRRVAVLFHPDEPIVGLQRRDLEPAARSLEVELSYAAVRANSDLEPAFRAFLAARPDAIFRLAGQAFVVGPQTAALALRQRLPAMLLTAQEVEAGALMSYWTDHVEHYRQAALHVDRILRGTPPGELPIEQPTRFELAFNLRTARALGVSLPQSLLLRADRVVE